MCSLLCVHCVGYRPSEATSCLNQSRVTQGTRIDYNCSVWLVSNLRRVCAHVHAHLFLLVWMWNTSADSCGEKIRLKGWKKTNKHTEFVSLPKQQTELERDNKRHMNGLSEVRQTVYISKLDTHSGLRNTLASSPSLKTLLAFSSPQNISHLMSCLTLHASLHVPFQSLFCFGLFPLSLTLCATRCISLILVQITVYTSKTYGRSVCSIAFFTFPLQIPTLINSAPVCICSESLLSEILSLPWLCVC